MEAANFTMWVGFGLIAVAVITVFFSFFILFFFLIEGVTPISSWNKKPLLAAKVETTCITVDNKTCLN